MELNKFFENMFGAMEAEKQDALEKATPRYIMCLIINSLDTAATLFALNFNIWILTRLLELPFSPVTSLLMVGDVFAIWFFTLFFSDKLGGFYNVYSAHKAQKKQAIVHKLKKGNE